MTKIREKLFNIAINKAYVLTDYNIQSTLDKQFEFRKQIILADKSLTKNEISCAINSLNKHFDYYKLLFTKGQKEFVKCQMETLRSDYIVEWIPYDNLKNIKFLTKGGCSEIYTAVWIDGSYEEWDSKEKQLKRYGEQNVVLKKSWFEEGKSHLSISKKYSQVVPCYGLIKDTSDGNYILVMDHMDVNLREYLQQNHNNLKWKERIQIIRNITFSLSEIHQENVIHRDLHSGNILFGTISQLFKLSDFGFCRPADKPLNILASCLCGKFHPDNQPPFINFENDCELALKIINGMRPKIVSGTPLEYKELMERCWDADPTKRPDTNTLFFIIE
uniref:Protein kinase domain-containing protein n=1 Tax=Rhizophagus irregularis (strain DAOM 181602 / DAOM 197198 / MUCL 43194) TaxID=747089 RepID=U9USF7_RHIID